MSFCFHLPYNFPSARRRWTAKNRIMSTGVKGKKERKKKTNMAVESERKLAAGKCVWCGNAEEAEARREENLYKRNNFSFSGKRAKVVRCKKIFFGARVCLCVWDVLESRRWIMLLMSWGEKFSEVFRMHEAVWIEGRKWDKREWIVKRKINVIFQFEIIQFQFQISKLWNCEFSPPAMTNENWRNFSFISFCFVPSTDISSHAIWRHKSMSKIWAFSRGDFTPFASFHSRPMSQTKQNVKTHNSWRRSATLETLRLCQFALHSLNETTKTNNQGKQFSQAFISTQFSRSLDDSSKHYCAASRTCLSDGEGKVID